MAALELTDPRTLTGDRIRAQFNLHTHHWSLVATSGPHRGRVIAHSRDLTLADVECHIGSRARDRIRVGGPRTVHAWVKGTLEAANTTPTLTGLIKVTYNPHRTEEFEDTVLGIPIRRADRIILAKTAPKATHGYMWITPEAAIQAANAEYARALDLRSSAGPASLAPLEAPDAPTEQNTTGKAARWSP